MQDQRDSKVFETFTAEAREILDRYAKRVAEGSLYPTVAMSLAAHDIREAYEEQRQASMEASR